MRDLGLLVLRVAFGGLLAFHGFGKVSDLLAGKTEFPDPLGIGSMPSFVLAALAESVFAILVVLGVKTRWTAVPVVITMAVAVLLAHRGDSLAERELALLYGAGFLALVFTGGGAFGVDGLFGKRRGRR